MRNRNLKDITLGWNNIERANGRGGRKSININYRIYVYKKKIGANNMWVFSVYG